MTGTTSASYIVLSDPKLTDLLIQSGFGRYSIRLANPAKPAASHKDGHPFQALPLSDVDTYPSSVFRCVLHACENRALFDAHNLLNPKCPLKQKPRNPPPRPRNPRSARP